MMNSTRKTILYSFLLIMLIGFSSLDAQGDNDHSNDPVYMLTYDHGGLILWGPEHFLERLRNAVSWLDRYPDFKIGLDNEAQIYDEFAEHNPEVLQEIKSCLEKYKGRFGIGTCTYGQPLSVFINEESNIRQIGYAIEADKKHLAVTPEIYLMSEHAMHSQMPQILNGFGFKGAIMRTHYMMYGYNPTFDVPIGWWVGLDKSKIATIPTYKGEGAEFGKTPIDNWILTRYPGPECKISLEDFRRQFSHIQPLLATRADDSGLRREELVKQYQGNPKFKWILLEELLDLYPAPAMDMITRPNDFVVRMPWGYCGNEIWNMSRKAEVQVLTAERLAAFEFLCGGANREADLQQSWKDLLVAQHHDVQICGLLPDARRFLPASLQASRAVINASMQFAAARMGAGGLQQVTVFNPLSWARTEWIQTTVNLKRGQAKNVAAFMNSRALPTKLLEVDRYSDGSILDARVEFAAPLQPLSLTGFSLQPADEIPASAVIAVDRQNLHIQTPYLDVVLDPAGGIASLVDRQGNRALLQPGKRSGFFTGLVEGKECESKGRWVIQQRADSTVGVVAVEHGFIADIPYTFELALDADSPLLRCKVDFDLNGQKIGQISDNKRDDVAPFVHEKKLRFKVFPAGLNNATGVRDLPFAVAETGDRYVEGNYWTACAGDEGGIALFNQGTMGSVREQDGGFSMPLVYAMYYIWGTRMLTGTYAYEFAVYPFSGRWQDADLHRKAIAYNFPAVSFSGDPGDGSLPDYVDALNMDSQGVLLSAFYVNHGDVLARFYESRGKQEKTTLKSSNDRYTLSETDLAGRVEGPVPAQVVFDPWKIRTFRMQFTDGPAQKAK
jgi:alpha-mannosidase